jgi:CheY-like chemotaxis protein
MSLQRTKSHLSVLIVEDQWLIRETIVQYFVNAGWSVLEADNGEEALNILAHGHSIDVVVTDIRLGGVFSGWDVADAFKKSRPSGRVVYTSANSVETRRVVANSVFIGKPYEPAEVLSAARG